MTVQELLARHPWMEEPLRTYYHALPELLADPTAEGRYAVVHGAETLDTWDTYRDALQFGLGRFQPGTFLVQRVDAKLLAPLAEVFGPVPAPEAAPCPA
jgi:hypothetical protein